MFFDDKKHPNVFFLDEALTRMVYVHDECPHSSFFSEIRKYPGACVRRPHFNCECERVNLECGAVLPFRRKFSTEDVGKKCFFWDAYGEAAAKVVLFPGEKSCECASVAEAKRKRRIEALMRRENNNAPLRKVAAEEVHEGGHYVSAAYYPWQKMSYDEWQNQCEAGEDAEKEYSRLRRAKFVRKEGGVYRKYDKVLKKKYTLAEETDLSRLIEKDLRVLLMLERKHAWQKMTSAA